MDQSTYWHRVREFYRLNKKAVMASKNDWGVDPYAWDFDAGIRMTPIEFWLWHDIRACGAVLHPQYPAGRFFVDFGNPVARVAIECDGAAYHTNKERDKERDLILASMGWTVYRISGRDCLADTQIAENPDTGALTIELSPARKLIASVTTIHGIEFRGGLK